MLQNVQDTKCLYYDIGVTKCLLRNVCYKMCALRHWWQPKMYLLIEFKAKFT